MDGEGLLNLLMRGNTFYSNSFSQEMLVLSLLYSLELKAEEMIAEPGELYAGVIRASMHCKTR